MSARVVLYMLAGLALPLVAAAERPSDPAHGLWLTENEKAIVELAPCGPQTCGRMVWVEQALDDSGVLTRTANRTEQALRDRPICGIELVGGLSRAAEGAWEQGWVFDPRTGATLA